MKTPQAIGALIPGVLRQLGIMDHLGEAKIFLLWKEIVGEKIDRVTAPLRVEGHKLFVGVENAVHRQELVYVKKEILGKINEIIGSGIIQDIRFTVLRRPL